MTEKKRAEDAVRLDQQLCFAVYGTAHAFNRAYKPLLEPLGLTYPQYLVLMALWEKDQSTVKALGDKLGLDSGTLSPLLKRLEAGGAIIRQRDPGDERQMLISLSEKGAALKEKAFQVAGTMAAATGCTNGEVTTLRETLVGLRDRLEKAARPE